MVNIHTHGFTVSAVLVAHADGEHLAVTFDELLAGIGDGVLFRRWGRVYSVVGITHGGRDNLVGGARKRRAPHMAPRDVRRRARHHHPR